jgi:hypothetical protein
MILPRTATVGLMTFALAAFAPASAIAAAGTTSAAPTPASTSPAFTRPSTPSPNTLAGAPLGSGNRAPVSHSGGEHISTLAIVIAAAGALLVLASLAWGLARRRALEPRWWLTLRHAIAEAGYRSSAAWAEFKDWLRIGR